MESITDPSTEVTDVWVKPGPPPPRTTIGGARPMAADTQALHDACYATPGEWFSIDAGTPSRASSKIKTLRKKGLTTAVRGSQLYAVLEAPEPEPEPEAA